MPPIYSNYGGAFNIRTNAAYSGDIDVCFITPNTVSSVTFAALRILHNEGGSLVDKTSFSDFASRRICGRVTSLSPFVFAQFLSPTAASVTVGGRVTTAAGRGIRNVRVNLTDVNGETQTTLTGKFGFYRFTDVPAGETYIFSVSARRYAFSQNAQVRSIIEETNDVNFTADNEIFDGL